LVRLQFFETELINLSPKQPTLLNMFSPHFEGEPTKNSLTHQPV
jgi:hypothetical protein